VLPNLPGDDRVRDWTRTSLGAFSGVHRRNLQPIVQGCGVDVVDGPVTAVTAWFRWDDLAVSMLNLLVIALLASCVAVALVPMSAVPIGSLDRLRV
jgi:hypothetical protein